MCYEVQQSHVLTPGPESCMRNASPLEIAKAAWRLGYPYFADRPSGGRLFTTPNQEPTWVHWHGTVYHHWCYPKPWT